jgi:hypothetical protein
MTWVLILALYQPLDRLETLIPVTTPFASYDACWLAGYRVSQLEDLNLSSRPAAKRIAWECVPTARPDLNEKAPAEDREGMRRWSDCISGKPTYAPAALPSGERKGR